MSAALHFPGSWPAFCSKAQLVLSDGTASLLFGKIPPHLQARFKSNHHPWYLDTVTQSSELAWEKQQPETGNVFTLMLSFPSLVISENKNSSPEAVVGRLWKAGTGFEWKSWQDCCLDEELLLAIVSLTVVGCETRFFDWEWRSHCSFPRLFQSFPTKVTEHPGQV